MNGSKRYWWLGIPLLIAALVLVIWLRGDDPVPQPTPTPSSTSEPVSTTFGSQLYFTFTLPSSWVIQAWTASEIRRAGANAQQAEPQVAEQLATFLAAVAEDTQILIAKPATGDDSTSLTVLSLPRHGLRLEQVAVTFTDRPAAELIDTNLRNDGAPVLLLSSDHLRSQEHFSGEFTLALMFHPDRHEFMLMIFLSPMAIDSTLVHDVIQSITFE